MNVNINLSPPSSQNSKSIKKAPAKDSDSKKSKLTGMEIRKLEKEKVSLFFTHNTQLGPPY